MKNSEIQLQETDEVNSLSADKTSTKSAEKPKRKTPYLLLFILFLIILSSGLSAYVWYLHDKQTKLLSSNISEIKKTLRNLDTHPVTSDLKERIQENKSDYTKKINGVTEELMVLTESILQTSDVVNRSQTGWVLEEVEYLISLAISRLDLIKDKETTIQLLEAAHQRLGSLSDSRLLPVRKAIANEITSLKLVTSGDLDDLALKIMSISQRLYKLPEATISEPKALAPTQKSLQDQIEQESPNWWQVFVNSFQEKVGLRKNIKSSNQLLSKEDLYYLDQILRHDLEAARQAILRMDEEDYQKRIKAAKEHLDMHYDQSNLHVKQIKTDLIQLQKLNLFPKYPDIKGLLDELKKVTYDYSFNPEKPQPLPDHTNQP